MRRQTPLPEAVKTMQADRAGTVLDVLQKATTARSRGAQRTRAGLRIVMATEPQIVYNAAGEPCGVEVWIEAYRNGTQLDIDPHRRFINPPTTVVEEQALRGGNGQVIVPRKVRVDPLAALWDILFDSVITCPSPETKTIERKVVKR